MAQSCTDHTLTEPATCDGSGVCAIPVPTTVDCAPFQCGATGSCATDPGVTAPPWITAFNATPAALPATGGSVTLSWTIVGATSVQLDQAIGDVTTLTSKVVQIGGNGSSQAYTLTASNDWGTVTAVTQVWLAGTYDVHGRVVDYNGSPLVAATVMVPGGVSTQSAADGTFTLLAVAAPYDLLVAAGSVDVALYRGITRPDPTVTVFRGQDGTSSSASIHGGLSSDAGFGRGSWNLGFVSDEAFPGSFTPTPTWYAADGGFTQTIQWAGSGPTTGTLYGLKGTGDDGQGNPGTYNAYAKVEGVTLHPGDTITDLQLVGVAPVPSAYVSGTVRGPDGGSGPSIDSVHIRAQLPGNQDFNIWENTYSPSVFDALVPALPGAYASVYVVTLGCNDNGAGDIFNVYGLVPGGAAAQIFTSAGVCLRGPPDATLGVDLTTVFTWDSAPQAVYVFQAIAENPLALSFTVVTIDPQAQLPDPTPLGRTFSKQFEYNWIVGAMGPVDGMDGAMAPHGLRGLRGRNHVELHSNTLHFETVSP